MTSSTETTSECLGVWGPALTAREQACLRCIAGHMIPASEAFGVPGADDPAILADMVASVRHDRQALGTLLRSVDAAAGGQLAALEAEAGKALLAQLRAADPAAFAVVEVVVVRSYYRDDRVLGSIGMEARPPFPKGYALPVTDWSLLDPVRMRGTIYRPAE